MENNNVNAAIVKKIIIRAQLIAETPLRIASGLTDGITDIMVLEDKQGRKMIPATSMAGVLKRAVASAYAKNGSEIEGLLFGKANDDNANQSMVIVSDVLLDKVEKIIRDGVAIDFVTCAGIDKQKYDFEAIERGAVGELVMEMTVRKSQADAIDNLKFKKLHENLSAVDDFAATLADILCSGIKIGAMTTKGFGQIKAQIAEVYNFNFTADKNAWKNYICNDKLPAPCYKGNAMVITKQKSSFVMSLDLALKDSLLIGDYSAAEELNVAHKGEEEYKTLSAVPMMSKNDYLIPGTSIKGVLRNRAMQLMLKIAGNEKDAAEFVENFMGYSRENDGKKRESKQSSLIVEEIYVPANEILKQHPQTRNRIDKFTGGTMNTGLFTEIPLWQHKKGEKAFAMNLELLNADPRQVGLMLLLLKDIYLGHVAFGSGKAIGRGVVQGRGAKISYRGVDFEFDAQGRLIGNDVKTKQALLEKYVKLLVGEV